VWELVSLLIALALASSVEGATAKAPNQKVELAGSPFTLIQNATSCQSCVVYTPKNHVSGTFSLIKGLPANATGVNISDFVSKFRFTDGHNTVRSESPSARKATFLIWTNEKREVSGYLITVEQNVAKSPEQKRRINALTMINIDGAKGEIAFANVVCKDEGSTVAEPKVNDVCRGNQLDALSSRAEHAPPSKTLVIRSTDKESSTPPPTPAPTVPK
jgi:hypothetical protein